MLRYRLRYVVLTVLYCGLIFFASHQPEPPGSGVEIPGLDKLVHAVIFGGLAGLVSFGLHRSNESLSAAAQFWIPVSFAALYGLTDEVHQIFVAKRTFEWSDLAADCSGALIVQLIVLGSRWRRSMRETLNAP